MTATANDRVFVHPLGLCESTTVGPGTRVWAFAHILEGAEVGADCNVCDHAYVEGGVRIGSRVTVKNAVLIFDGVVIEDDVFLGPSMVFTNDFRPRAFLKKDRECFDGTLVRRGATIGADATIVCGVTIGEYAFVAAAALVNHDVGAYELVAGVPAHRIGWVCSCGNRLGDDLSCQCGAAYVELAGGREIQSTRPSAQLAEGLNRRASP